MTASFCEKKVLSKSKSYCPLLAESRRPEWLSVRCCCKDKPRVLLGASRPIGISANPAQPLHLVAERIIRIQRLIVCIADLSTSIRTDLLPHPRLHFRVS